MIEGQEGVTWAEWCALAAACEEHGLEGLFRSDHYTSLMGFEDRGSLDAWTTLAALAARTERIRLGTLVSPATFRHPSVLAKMVTTVDHASGGRAELGLGAGWHEGEHRAYGFPFPDLSERLARFAEQLEIVHREWTEEDVDFDGHFYRLEGLTALPRPVQQPHPRLIVGGSGRRGTVEPAVRFADEYNTVYASVEECRERRARLDAACERVGRDPATIALSLMTGCVIGADADEVRERERAVIARTGGNEEYLRQRTPGWLVGTVDEIGTRLVELEAAGVERVFLQHLDHADVDAVALMGAL